MQARAVAKYVKISSGKVNRFGKAVKRMPYQKAKATLLLASAKGARVLADVVQSAVSNLMANNKNIDEEGIIIEEIGVDEGPTLKRWTPRARGRADRRRKRTCHISVVVSGEEIKK
ncbi:MAG TPA: 50S ribosomal protein L22 [Spirochaetota bacterium]|nr:50S ribosomal protein L22 [Spirochaetota bacterium]